jgi:hypothetical protein
VRSGAKYASADVTRPVAIASRYGPSNTEPATSGNASQSVRPSSAAPVVWSSGSAASFTYVKRQSRSSR